MSIHVSDLDERPPLEPEARALATPDRPISGVACPLADGREWLLARMGVAAGLGPLRDRLYEGMSYAGRVSASDVRLALWFALRENYDLSPDELLRLVDESGGWRIGAAVDGVRPLQAICGAYLPTEEDCEYGYDDWLRATLIANGIDPAGVPPDDLPAVLALLIDSKRAVHPSQFVSSAIAGGQRRAAREIARAQAAARAAAPVPEADSGGTPAP